MKTTTGFVTASADGKRSHVFVANTPSAAKPATPMAAACTLSAPCRTCRIRARSHNAVDRDLAAKRAKAASDARARRMDWVKPILGR